MNPLNELELLARYSTNRNDLISEFYSPCLERSIAYDRAVGFFTSSILLLASKPIAEFAIRGGHIRIICSPELTKDDIEAINNGYALREAIGQAINRIIEQAVKDTFGKPIVEFFATLIAINCVDIKIAFRLGSQGIFHDKLGIFYDDLGNWISFTGSSNETFSAWDSSGNHESFDVFRSWSTENYRVNLHKEYFNQLWNGEEPGVEIVHFPQISLDYLRAYANPEGINNAYQQVAITRSTPRKVLLPHQRKSIESWERKGMRGILEHATGSGKTFTAISAIYKLLATHPVLILVPSELLLKQWYYEIQENLLHLNPKILLVGGGNSSWQKEDVIEGFTEPNRSPRIIIATIQSASNPMFLNRVRGGEHLFIVIDEVHRVGSPTFSQVLSINTGPRLGLSATPKRYGDPDGTLKIMNYFEGIVEPPFTLADAIASGRLCQYTYHIHEVYLTESETEEWRLLTNEIKTNIAKSQKGNDTGIIFISDFVKLLLIKRARITKRAIRKISLVVDVIEKYYRPGQRWLIYCDSKSQLISVRQALENAGYSNDEYYSGMFGDRDTTLDYFKTQGGLLVAIKCLDEGVDIPNVDHALIIASSKNPREFIQRRGRVLRVAPNKYYAEIHDALVLPLMVDQEPDDIAILKGELARAYQFSKNSTNQAIALQLRKLAIDYGIDPEGMIVNNGYEDDEEGEE